MKATTVPTPLALSPGRGKGGAAEPRDASYPRPRGRNRGARGSAAGRPLDGPRSATRGVGLAGRARDARHPVPGEQGHRTSGGGASRAPPDARRARGRAERGGDPSRAESRRRSSAWASFDGQGPAPTRRSRSRRRPGSRSPWCRGSRRRSATFACAGSSSPSLVRALADENIFGLALLPGATDHLPATWVTIRVGDVRKGLFALPATREGVQPAAGERGAPEEGPVRGPRLQRERRLRLGGRRLPAPAIGPDDRPRGADVRPRSRARRQLRAARLRPRARRARSPRPGRARRGERDGVGRARGAARRLRRRPGPRESAGRHRERGDRGARGLDQGGATPGRARGRAPPR